MNKKHIYKSVFPLILFLLMGCSSTGLLKAVKERDGDKIWKALQRGANINERDENGLTPLHYMAIYGDIEIVQLLIERGANMCIRTKKFVNINYKCYPAGNNPYQMAKIARNTEIVEYLRKYKEKCELEYKKINEKERKKPVRKAEPILQNIDRDLIEAARQGDMTGVRKALKKGANVNANDKYGYTALMRASWFGHKKIAELLLLKGALVNAKACGGASALTMALRTRNTKIADLLILKGADVNAKNEWGKTALMLALEKGFTKTAEIIILKGADINAKNKWGETALMIALEKGQMKLIELLISKGADINAKDNRGRSILMWASIFGHTKTAENIIVKGPLINAQDKNGYTALMYASYQGHTKTAAILISKRADVNIKDKWGDTALLKALEKDHNKTAELLILNGTDVNNYVVGYYNVNDKKYYQKRYADRFDACAAFIIQELEEIRLI